MALGKSPKGPWALAVSYINEKWNILGQVVLWNNFLKSPLSPKIYDSVIKDLLKTHILI